MFSLLLFLSETITRALGPSLQQAHGDLQIYYSVGHSIVVKKIPFKNLEFEYPLLSIIPFLIPFILYGKELTFDYYYYLYPRTVVIYAVITFVSSLLLLRKLGARFARVGYNV